MFLNEVRQVSCQIEFTISHQTIKLSIKFTFFPSLDLRPNKALGPRGRPRRIIQTRSFGSSFTLTLLCKLDSPDLFHVNVRQNSNTQRDFYHFLKELIEGQHLKQGDFLVIDNASVHVGDKYHDKIVGITQRAGVRIVCLPTYSPELNPCELVFGYMKKMMRSDALLGWNPVSQQFQSYSLIDKMRFSLMCISRQTLIRFYYHCMYPKSI